ncbi:MAG: MMPL family transporter [Actinobacteria bacterium]|nr:MMPL family transporter [Actinomycetota bacterium]
MVDLLRVDRDLAHLEQGHVVSSRDRAGSLRAPCGHGAGGRLPPRRPRVVSRIGGWCARRRWIVIVLWIALLAGVGAAGILAGGRTNANLTVPGTSAQTGADLANRAFPTGKGLAGSVVVYGAPGVLREKRVQRAIEKAVKDARTLPRMGSVQSPLEPGGLISKDASTAVIGLSYDLGAEEVRPATYRHLQEAMRPLRAVDGLRIAYTGTPAAEEESATTDISDALGLVAAMIILLVAFGTALAMVSPLLSAVAGLLLGVATIKLLSAYLQISSIGPILATMIGLGVGIDYAVFLVNRQRENLLRGVEPLQGIRDAMGTAGRTVLVAGLTVAIALLGLATAQIPFVTMLGVTASVAVLTAILSALTLQPALLAVMGQRVIRKRDRAAPPATTGEDDVGGGSWGRWARLVGSHPVPFLLLAVAILGVLTVPLLQMRLGQVDAGSDPPGSTTRIAYDQLAKAFGPGFNGPIEVVLHPYADAGGAKRVVEAIAKDPDVEVVAPPAISKRDRVVVISVTPKSAPTDDRTQRLVERLPRDVQRVTGPEVRVYATGVTAGLLNLSDRIAQRLPIFIAAVILLSFILLLVEFKSVLVPLKAAIMNALSIGAAYGAIVAIFQWGWGASLIGLEETVMIEAYAPMMMFAILFGLSMDYEVFLISRIREAHLRGASALRSVEVGLSHTARVITAAALIMITVFLSFVLEDGVIVKMFGIGLATAVLVDATIVRLMLVPSTMVLLGEANWWLPGFLRRLLRAPAPATGPPSA